jgi:hypothetical protein
MRLTNFGRFRELAGFSNDEVEVISEMDREALEERKEQVRLAREFAGMQPEPA